ncbi:hypothetical protein A2V82_14195 [candidate division KSB1 bacterium RBG_16_48_16]|nr:MAG: hypothetical protein A2V82_14195 [candidate division KSB1 bacterium RBG_16_48_16]
MFLIIGFTNPQLPRSINFFRDLFLTQTDDFRFIFYQLDFNSQVRIEAEIKPDQLRTLVIKPQFSLSSPENGSQTVISDEADVSSTLVMPSENIEKLILNSSIKKKGQGKPKNFRSEISIEETTEGIKQKIKAPNNYKESMRGFFINADTVYKDLSPRIENIIVKKQKDVLLEPLRNIEPKIRDISFGNNGMIYVDVGYSRLMPVNLLGDGIRRMLSILAKVLDTKDGIILLDEIENGLHYSSLKVFLKYLIRMSELQNVQLFLTTHSKETLNNLSEILSTEEFKKFRSDIRSFTIRKHEKDKTISYPYDFEKLEYAIEQDIEMR